MTTTEPVGDLKQGQLKNLVLATWTFLIAFWAWNLIAPLNVLYKEEFHLTSAQKALLVATPVLVGSVGRIATGAMTDRLGGRKMFTALSLFTVIPVLMV